MQWDDPRIRPFRAMKLKAQPRAGAESSGPADVPFGAAEEATLRESVVSHGEHAWELVADDLVAAGYPPTPR